MKFRMKTAGLTVLAATILAACGGGGGGSASSGGGTTTALAGVVVDGLIEGATVCLDLNVNLVCEAGEPSATTAANGSYSLSLAGLTTAQIRGAHIITSVPLTAKDADDGGQTLAQAGKAPFNLMSPAEAFVSADGATISAAVVSPLTTLVSHEMMSGSGKTAAAAEAAVAGALGLTAGTNLRSNFFGKTDAASVGMQKQARFIAAALGEVKSAIGTGASGSTDRERQLGALNYLKTNVTALLTAINNSTASTAAAQLQAAKAALANASVMPAPVASALVTGAQAFASASTSMDAVASDWATVIGAGFYNADCSSSSSSSSSSNPVTTYTCNEWSHSKVAGNGAGKWISEPFVLNNSAWTPRLAANYPNTNFSYTLTSNGWTMDSIESTTGTYASDGVGGMNVVSDTGGFSPRMRLAIKDVSGKMVSDLIGTETVTTNSNSLGSIARYLPTSTATTFRSTVFPTGSKLFAFNSTYDADQYYIYGQQSSASTSVPTTSAQTGDVTITGALSVTIQTMLTSLSGLISTYSTTSGSNQKIYLWNTSSSSSSPSVQVTFDAGGSTTGGTMSVWEQSTTYPYAWTQKSEKGAYEIRTVSGQQVLVIVPPASVIATRTAPVREQIYAVRNGKLYQGGYESIAYRNYRSGSPNWNDVAMKAILAGAGFPTVAK